MRHRDPFSIFTATQSRAPGWSEREREHRLGSRVPRPLPPYQFHEIKDGVYRDTIYDRNVSRFRIDGPFSKAGVDVLVGNVTQEDVRLRRTDGLTFVFAR